MKKIILILVAISFNVNAGLILLVTDNGLVSINICTLNLTIYSDENNQSKFYFTCPQTNIDLVNTVVSGKTSSLTINNNLYFECPVIESSIYSTTNFRFIVNCQENETYLFKSGFD